MKILFATVESVYEHAHRGITKENQRIQKTHMQGQGDFATTAATAALKYEPKHILSMLAQTMFLHVGFRKHYAGTDLFIDAGGPVISNSIIFAQYCGVA